MSEEQTREIRGDWSVVVLYENEEARELGVQFCDSLVERFWTRYNFDVSWWPFALLGDVRSAAQASGKAQVADLMLFASATGDEPPRHVQNWIESWLPARNGREGAIVAVAAQGRPAHLLEMCLRRIAHAAGLDFLTGVPQHMRRPMPESIDSYTERAGRITTVLDEIMIRRTRTPTL